MKLKEICEQVGIEYNSKNPKRSLEQIKKYYLIEQNGTKKDYTIIRKLSDEEIRSKCKITPYKDQFNVIEPNKYASGVYRIIDDKNKIVYVGQTKNFYNRFLKHCSKSTKSVARPIIVNNGALFEILELEDDLYERLKFETMWANRYIDLGYKVLNNTDKLYKKHINKPKYTMKKQKHINKSKYTMIRINKNDYDNVISLLEENNIDYKEWKK